MEKEEAKKYVQMENVLNKINQKFISLPEGEKKRNSKILLKITEKIKSTMKTKNLMFKTMFERTFYGGSYYDGLKVGKPEEYDLDFVLNLPLLAEPDVTVSNKHGFVHVHIEKYAKLLQSPDGKKFEELRELLDDNNFVSTEKVLRWIEKIMSFTLSEIEKDGEGYYFMVDIDEKNLMKIYATISKAHPAFTLKLKSADGSVTLDIDLVPCFQFTDNKWPKGQYRANPSKTKNKFLVVPKKPHDQLKAEDVGKYWRLSFQEQERELLIGNKAMKPCIKLLKLLRDKNNHKIVSYFIKTVLLWEVGKHDDKFWNRPLSVVFMQMLQQYTDLIEKKTIPYFWNKNYNLIGHLKDATLIGIANHLKGIIKDVNQNLEDPFRIAKYLVNDQQIEILKTEVPLSKKLVKQTSCIPNISLSSEDSVDFHVDIKLKNGESGTSSSDTDSCSLSKEPTKQTNSIPDDFVFSRVDHGAKNSLQKTVTGTSSTDYDYVTVLKESLHGSSDRLTDAIQRLYEQNIELKESNKEIKKICEKLNDRVSVLERKIQHLTLENKVLTSEVNKSSVPNVIDEFDRLFMSSKYLEQSKDVLDRLNK